MDRREFVTRLLITITILSAIFLVLYAFQIILLIFAGCLLAVFLHGLAGFFQEKLNLPENLCLTFVILLIVVLLGSGVWFFGQNITAQADEFGKNLQKAYNAFMTQARHTGWGAHLLKAATDGVNKSDTLLVKLSDIFTATAGTLIDVFVTVFLGLFLAYEHNMYKKGLKSLLPERHQRKLNDLIHHTGHVLRWWMFGQFIYMLSIGVMSVIGLLILGIPQALSLGILAMLLSFVPYLGTIISAIPAMLIALSISNHMALYVFALYIFIHTIDAYLLAPLIQLEAISLPPALTIASQILMAYLAGGLGLVLATPLIAVVIVLVQVLYMRNVLGKNVTLIGPHRGETPNDTL